MDERWSDDGKRCDGLAIIAGLDGYVIKPASGVWMLERCPCCGEAFPFGDKGLSGARAVADMLYPIREERRHASG